MKALKSSRRELLKAAAWHEAGHAVMRWLLLSRGTRTAIDFGRPGAGYSEGTHRSISVGDHLLITLAGPVAEGIGLGPLFAKLDLKGSLCRDLEKARRTIRENGFGDVEVCLQKYVDDAERLLWPHYNAIEQIALMLLKRGIISGRRVRSVMSGRYRSLGKAGGQSQKVRTRWYSAVKSTNH